MSLNLEKLAKALKVDTSLSDEDRVKLKQMRETGFYGCESAKEELYAGRILKRISELVEKVDSIKEDKINDEILANWCKDFMDKIEQIAKEKYPNVTYWCDTGSDYNVIMAMLEKFRKDL